MPQGIAEGPWTVDAESQTLSWSGGTIELTAREFELVEYFRARPNVVVTRKQLESDVWGFAEGVRSEVVPVTVRRLRRKLGGTGLQTLRGRGWRLVVHDEKAPPSEGFFGRTNDLQDVRDLLDGSRWLVSVVGPGGVGKTRLTRELCATTPGTWRFVDLSAASDAESMANAMAAALSASAGEGDARGAVSNALGRLGACTVVVDNLEQLPAAAIAQLAAWHQAAPEVRFVATSRQRLGLPGEHVLRLEPLSTPAAVALFVNRARTYGVHIDPESRELEELVEQLDRLPLALELAAARTQVLDLPGLLQQLERRFRLLTSTEEGPERHLTLRACVAWSWDALTPTEARTLEQLAVFAGSFSLADAEAVVDVDDDEWVLDVMQRLVDRSLLHRRSRGHFAMLETMKAYGRERLQADGELASAFLRHGAWFARLGRWPVFEQTLMVGRASGSIAQREARAEIAVALERQARAPQPEIYAGLVVASWAITRWIGPFGTIRPHFVRVLGMELELESAAVVCLCAHEEALLSWQCRHPSGFDPRWRELSPTLFGRVVDIWGRMELRMGNRASGWEHLERAAQILSEAGASLPEISARVILAASKFQVAFDPEEGAPLLDYERRLRALDHPRLQVECALYLASVTIERSDTSLHLLERALNMAREAGDMVSASRCAWAIGVRSVELHRERLTRGMQLFRELSAGLYHPDNLRWLALEGDIALIDNDPDGAERAYLRGLGLADGETVSVVLARRLGALALNFDGVDPVPCLVEAIRLRPDMVGASAATRLLLATYLRRHRRLDEAAEQLAQVDPEDLRHHYANWLAHFEVERAMAQLERGDVDGAHRVLQGIRDRDSHGLLGLGKMRVAAALGDGLGFGSARDEAVQHAPTERHPRSAFWRIFDAMASGTVPAEVEQHPKI